MTHWSRKYRIPKCVDFNTKVLKSRESRDPQGFPSEILEKLVILSGFSEENPEIPNINDFNTKVLKSPDFKESSIP